MEKPYETIKFNEEINWRYSLRNLDVRNKQYSFKIELPAEYSGKIEIAGSTYIITFTAWSEI